MVWNWTTDNGLGCGERSGSSPNLPGRHGDAIRELLNDLDGPGWIPVPYSGCDSTFGKYDCTHTDGRKFFIAMYSS